MNAPGFDDTIRAAASDAQKRAAHHGVSVFVEANAGSGKTRVLVDRVVNILLQGVAPEEILCVTYTKAAAAEMKDRLFTRLGRWSVAGAEELERDLKEQLGHDDLPVGQIEDARRLFARALETPGGLKIQTIHAFCENLLRRFPLEAGVSPQFHEMEDRAAQLLRADVLDRLSEGPHGHLVAELSTWLTADPDPLLAELCATREAFLPPRAPEEVLALYGLAPEDDAETLLDRVFLGGEIEFIAEIVPHLRGSGANDSKAGAALSAVTEPSFAALEILDSQPRDFIYEGEMHVDSALDPELRERLMPENRMEGAANVLIFAQADAASGVRNILRLKAGALEVGPILMGLGNRAHIVTPSITSRGLLNMAAVAGTPVASYG